MMKIYTNPNMTEEKEELQTRTLTFRERWIHPILHPATIPFEPWRRTETKLVTVTVPSDKFILFPSGEGIICHPRMYNVLKQRMESKGWI